MRLCNRCGSPDLNTGFVCRACGLAPYDNAIFERPQPSASTASTTIHTLAHSKGVPSAAREAMLMMQKRIAELEAESLAHKMHIAALSGNCLAKRDRITHQDAVIAGLVKALEWVEYCDGLGTFRKRDGREVVVSFEDSDEGMKFFETISDFIDNARKSLAKAKESRDGIL